MRAGSVLVGNGDRGEPGELIERDRIEGVLAVLVVTAVAATDHAQVAGRAGRVVGGGDGQRRDARRTHSIGVTPDGVFASAVDGRDDVDGLRSVDVVLREVVSGLGGRLLGGLPERHPIGRPCQQVIHGPGMFRRNCFDGSRSDQCAEDPAMWFVWRGIGSSGTLTATTPFRRCTVMNSTTPWEFEEMASRLRIRNPSSGCGSGGPMTRRARGLAGGCVMACPRSVMKRLMAGGVFTGRAERPDHDGP